MNNAEATRRLGLTLPITIGDEAANRIRANMRRRMFKKNIVMLTCDQIDACIDTYNEALEACRCKEARVRRLSVISRSQPNTTCYGMLLDWVAAEGKPLPNLVTLENRGDAPVLQVDVVVTPPVAITLRGHEPRKTIGHGTQFLNMQWSLNK